MHSWETLEPIVLKPAGVISAAFIAAGATDFRAAAKYIQGLAYGRNENRSDPLAVIHEGRGTCSTKHALLRRLALEQNVNVTLFLGIYEMNGRNTPGVGEVFTRHGLESLPEAHCYLRSGHSIVDVTRSMEPGPREQIKEFIYEEEISPEQIGAYKVSIHRRFLKRWMEQQNIAHARTLDDLWRIREECITALERS